jgi:hypothetical protein
LFSVISHSYSFETATNKTETRAKAKTKTRICSSVQNFHQPDYNRIDDKGELLTQPHQQNDVRSEISLAFHISIRNTQISHDCFSSEIWLTKALKLLARSQASVIGSIDDYRIEA